MTTSTNTTTTATRPALATPSLRAPSPWALLGESRALLDMAWMLPTLLRPASTGAALLPRHIVVLPGFGADDASTWPLRRYLNRLGQKAEGWGLGRNVAGTDIKHTAEDIPPGWSHTPKAGYKGEGGVPMLCEKAKAHVLQRHSAHREHITLIGWSLGGYIAREIARDLPNVVAQVITLGSPVTGGPKYTAAAGFFKLRQMDLDWIESESNKREERPITVPITAIVSPSDGVVGYGAALDRLSPNVTHHVLNASHVGLGFNPDAWALVQGALRQADVNAAER